MTDRDTTTPTALATNVKDRRVATHAPLTDTLTDSTETAPAGLNGSSSDAPLSVVAAYVTLDEARQAVKTLVKVGFKTTEVNLYGTAFRGKVSEQHFWQGPLYRGSIAGLVGGAVVGLLFGFVSLTSVVSGPFYTIFSEMVLGAATGFLGFMAARAQGGFQSDEVPQRFEVMVPAALADKAAKVLSR